MVTKADLNDIVSKEDARQLASQEDLQKLLTPNDLDDFATKSDLSLVENNITEGVRNLLSDTIRSIEKSLESIVRKYSD